MPLNLGHQELPDTPLERAMMLQNMLMSLAQNGNIDDSVYAQLRSEFMQDTTRLLLPEFIRTCRDQNQLWSFLKQVASGTGSWAARRSHIDNAFRPLLDHLEGRNSAPADTSISEALLSFDPDGVHRAWERALNRRNVDPEGAITAARTLLETVCMRILDDAGETYGPSDDLPNLYGRTSRILSLAPSQHTEDAFRAILGGCHTVVQNLGTLRNRISDAHGQGRNPVRPAPRHAALAVNLAGTMATFLVETWLTRQSAQAR
ncbi:MAG: abortive infection family protein [Rhodospirillales bacterium]|nr:abortive infection family protein [Rhodospirillales bacterium]